MNSLITPLKQGLLQLLPGSELTTQYLYFPKTGSPEIVIELQLLSLESTKLHLSSEQIGAFWQHLPYWAFAWAAGQGLAGYLLNHPELVKGKRVLDFGCGSGLVGIAAAKAGAKSVVCCDTDPLALLAVKENARRNNVNIDVINHWESCELERGHVAYGNYEREDELFDCLLAADVLYDLTSAGDLSNQCKKIPHWLVAETQFQLPPWTDLKSIGSTVATTLPVLDDFDKNLAVSIYERK